MEDVYQSSPIFILLRSSDGAQFRVTSSCLTARSAVFSAMLEFPHTEPGIDDDSELGCSNQVPIVDLSESGQVLAFLVFYIDPHVFAKSASWQTSDVSVLRGAIIAADKYDITGILGFVRLYVTGYWTSLAQNPVALFSFVAEFHFDELLWRASRETLKINIETIEHEQIVKQYVSPEVARSLGELHRTRKRVLGQVVLRGCAFVLGGGHGGAKSTCYCGASLDSVIVQSVEYLMSVVRAFVENRPLGEALWSRVFWENEARELRMKSCSTCGVKLFSIEKVLEALSEQSFAYGCC